MKLTSLKSFALLSATALSLVLAIPQNAHAQNVSIPTTFTVASGITAALVNPLDFGTWVVNHGGADTLTITVAPMAGAPTFTPGGVVAPTSKLVNITPPATAGQATVTVPAALALTVELDSITPFAQADLTLGTVRYATTTEAPTTMTVGNLYPVTVLAGATPEPVYFGGTVSIAGAIPNATYNDATLEIIFAY